MSRFSTRNSDGASGRGEPVNTVPAKAAARLKKEAARHGCDTTAELFEAPSLGGPWKYDLKGADRTDMSLFDKQKCGLYERRQR